MFVIKMALMAELILGTVTAALGAEAAADTTTKQPPKVTLLSFFPLHISSICGEVLRMKSLLVKPLAFGSGGR